MQHKNTFILSELDDLSIAFEISSFFSKVFNSSLFNHLEAGTGSTKALAEMISSVIIFYQADIYVMLNPQKTPSELFNILIDKRNINSACFLLMREEKAVKFPTNFNFKKIPMTEIGLRMLVEDISTLIGIKPNKADYKKFLENLEKINPSDYIDSEIQKTIEQLNFKRNPPSD